MLCKQRAFDGCCLIPWDVTLLGWPAWVTLALLAAQVAGKKWGSPRNKADPGFSSLSPALWRNLRATRSKLQRLLLTPVRSLQAQRLAVWKLLGLIPKFKTSLGRWGMGIAVGIAQLGRGGNQKVENERFLLCRVAWSRTRCGRAAASGGRKMRVGARSKAHPSETQQPRGHCWGTTCKN